MMFPAIWIAREGSFGVIDRPMDGGSYLAYRRGFFEGLRFFDVSGSEWAVVAALPTRQPGPLARLLNRRIELDIRLGPPTQPPLSEVADSLCSCVDRDPGDLYDQFVTHDELKVLFRAATSAADLVRRA